jgi:hypothetical protein
MKLSQRCDTNQVRSMCHAGRCSVLGFIQAGRASYEEVLQVNTEDGRRGDFPAPNSAGWILTPLKRLSKG